MIAYLLLILTPLFWAGNHVAAKGVADIADPLLMAFLRWGLAFLILLPFWLPKAIRQWPVIKAHFPLLFWLSLTSVGCFNTFIYLGVETTTATNTTLMHAIIPVLILLLNRLFFKESVGGLQWLGIASSLLGVLVLITQGELQRVASLHLNPGDIWILAAIVTWALYSITLKFKPKELEPFTFFGLSVLIGLVVIFPFALFEQGGFVVPTLEAPVWAVVVYVAIFPSILSYSFWNRGVALLGASTAGLFIYLIPVFGTLLSILVLNETMHSFHLVGIALIVLGIWLAVVRRVLAGIRQNRIKTVN